ncbi:RNA polymerase II C-terminal domain phosphatase-like 4 isoform X2 [Cryptomeria japonica]|uniref:RNA polymerase II C-terminal domain phosphatase-like 4 isoform X2 n=1 Tax=Cryptomeria japonica TaxID=3369 RepID=UPI0027DA22FA|nr:RNA polymerase II C-terminal domain phosphatase-like 4 isoform X2 [Cryptomeria japonica]
MSVATESPSPSSSNDDFARLLDVELQSSNEEESEEETQSEIVQHGNAEEEKEKEEELFEYDQIEAQRTKRQRLCDGGMMPVGRREVQVSVPEDNKDNVEASSSSPTCPPHPGFMWGVCIRCGVMKPNSDSDDQTGVALKYIHKDFELTDREVARLRNNDLKKLLPRKKLYLVLDLDHTLLNSARFVEVPHEEAAYVTSTYLKGVSNAESVGETGRSLYRLISLQMWTKLRPFVHEFLEEASEMYEMYVYTMGERAYALKMARLLDPTGKHFGTRVISQGDSTRRHQKDLDVVLGAESAVVILDDTEQVWPRHRSNLIVMERYHFFSSSCRQFNLQSPSLTHLMRDETETEGALASMLRVLRSVHQMFFNKDNDGLAAHSGFEGRDVRQVLRAVRLKILEGCKIVFSRIFPTAYPAEKHHLWRLAEELGATCSTTLDESVTHVVALDLGTDKARWAVQNKRYLVHPQWLEAASYMWQRQIEGNFSITTKKNSSASTFVESIPVLPQGTDGRDVESTQNKEETDDGDIDVES